MKSTSIISLIIFLAASVLSGCGGGGDDGDPNAPAIVNVIASKTVALANGADAVTIQADVKKADGTAVADGTTVTFSAGSATLSAATAATTNGTASVSMTSAAISGANNYTAPVTATSGGASGTKSVKFINQPTSADVTIAFNPAVTNLAALDLTLNSTAGASFDNAAQPQTVSAINAADGSFVLGNFNSVANSTRVNLINANGCNTGTTPIIKATFAVVQPGLPTFSVSATANFTAADSTGATLTAVTAANMVVSVTYNTEL